MFNEMRKGEQDLHTLHSLLNFVFKYRDRESIEGPGQEEKLTYYAHSTSQSLQ